jgi:ribokinase
MTIKEIAKIAGVSVSTVSKIINGKDENIGDKTRAHVLQLVKDYNYSPYSYIKQSSKASSFRIGVLLKRNAQDSALLHGIIQEAEKSKYGVLIYLSDNEEQEFKNISRLCAQGTDGVLYAPINPALKWNNEFTKKGIPALLLEAPLCIDYKALGCYLTELLMKHMHRRIGCLFSSDQCGTDFAEGYKRCLFEHNIHFNQHLFLPWDQNAPDKLNWLINQVTGIICYNQELAIKVYETASQKNLKIPRDLSIAGLTDELCELLAIPPLSGVHLPLSALGQSACSQLIAKIEKNHKYKTDFKTPLEPIKGDSVDLPSNLRHQRIVVVGAINMDTMLYVNSLPKTGETMTIKNCAAYPGGKGVNEAIGAAKLGAEVSLIGRLGQDYEGRAISDLLNANNVNMEGVAIDPKCATGKAYISVQADGSSSIAIYGGANSRISPTDIEKNAYLFDGASFCLLPTELNMDVIEYASKVAKEKGVKVLVKPSVITTLSDEFLSQIDILLPNRNEIATLCPSEHTLEKQAQYFLDCGVRNVIITLAEEGCYLRNSKQSKFFKAANFKPVDTTGAADAFAATLAVYLSKGCDLETAITYANIASGISITRQGGSSALPDKNTLALYLGK